MSLECSYSNDEISTAPVIRIIRNKYPSLLWIGTFVGTFIFISIGSACDMTSSHCLKHNFSVSFLTIGSGLKVQLDGYAAAQFAKASTCTGLWRYAPLWLRSHTVCTCAFMSLVNSAFACCRRCGTARIWAPTPSFSSSAWSTRTRS